MTTISVPPTYAYAEPPGSAGADAPGRGRRGRSVARLVRGVALAAVLGAVLGLAVGLVLPRWYTSTASFVPQGRRTPSQFAGLAAQFGVSLPAGDAAQSPQFYADLLTSDELLGRLADSPLDATGGTAAGAAAPRGAAPVAAILRPDVEPAGARRVMAVRELRKRVRAFASAKTGTVEVTVTTRDPAFSAALCTQLMSLIDRFNQENRRSQGAAERAFTERRLSEARAELRAAENRLQDFRRGNRTFAAGSDLVLDEERLQREVIARQSVVTTLTQAFEQARIEEVRDTPVFTVIERPRIAAVADSRGLAAKILMGALAGGTLAYIVLDLRRLLARVRGEQAA